MGKKPLTFYDLKRRRKFTTTNYSIVKKKVKGRLREFAKAKAPSGITVYRILPSKKRKR